MPTRRAFLGCAASSSLLWLCGCQPAARPTAVSTPSVASALASTLATSNPFPGAQFVRNVPFLEGRRIRPQQLMGEGLDGRLYTDISTLADDEPVTPVEHFYVRTAPSALLDTRGPWSVSVHGLVSTPRTLDAATLVAQARPQGVHLMECSGNGHPLGFRLISTGQWDGVPLLDAIGSTQARRVKVTGFDTYPSPSRTRPPSIPGASWIFSLDELAHSGAFLATHLNGQPLTAAHGAPLRLVVPGWYGCCCIKWVNDLELVDDDAPATSHMQEFASRTLQDGVPKMARDFVPAVIDATAMPIRVELWQLGPRCLYRMVGIVWGGTRPVERLSIRIGADQPFVPVSYYHPPSDSQSWAFWYHRFEPRRRGRYRVDLKVADAGVRTRRLDRGWYTRRLRIAAVSVQPPPTPARARQPAG